MDFTRRIELDTSFDEAVPAVTEALKEQGFGPLTRIDVRQTLKDKLDIDVDAQVILGACNPRSPTGPRRSTRASPRFCRATVVRTEGGRIVVEALDPKIMAEVPDNPALALIARRGRAAHPRCARALRERVMRSPSSTPAPASSSTASPWPPGLPA